MKHSSNQNLPAPAVPVAEPDGLINIRYLSDSIKVLVPIQTNARTHDRYSIVINQSVTSLHQVLTDPLTAQLRFSVPAGLFTRDGTYEISYGVTSYPGGTLTTSESIIIKIDRTPPGALYLAPMLFAEGELSDIFPGSVNVYLGMTAGDTIHTLCEGIPGPSHQVTDKDFSGRPIQIIFSRRFLQSLSSNSIHVTYYVVDRAGNRSIESEPVELTGWKPENGGWTPSGADPDDVQWISSGTNPGHADWAPSGNQPADTGWSPSGL